MCVRNQVMLFESEMELGQGKATNLIRAQHALEKNSFYSLYSGLHVHCTGTIFWKVFYLTLRAKVKSGDVAMFGVLDAHI